MERETIDQPTRESQWRFWVNRGARGGRGEGAKGLPGGGEEFYGGGVFERGEEIGDRAMLAREEQIGADVGEGGEDEAAQVQARVRDDDFFVREDEIAEVEDVEIERARGVARALGRAAVSGFDPLEGLEEDDGGTGELDFDHGVQVGARLWAAADGFGLVDAGAQERAGDPGESSDGVATGAEFSEAISEIRAKSNTSAHLKRRSVCPAREACKGACELVRRATDIHREAAEGTKRATE